MGNSLLDVPSLGPRDEDPDARRLLSHRGFECIQDPNFRKLIGIIQDTYDEKTNPHGWVSLGVAENRLMHDELINYINKNCSLINRDLTYGDGGYGSKRLRSTLASFLATHFQPCQPISEENIVCTPGVGIALEITAAMLANPGEGFLLGRPYYSGFLRDIGLRSGAKAITVSFGDLDCFSIEAVSKYEEALLTSKRQGVRIRGLILCSPHNPLGRCYPRETLVAFMKLCQKYQIHLLSDEIYALSVWSNPENVDAVEFTSILEIETEGLIDRNLTHVFWGLSKDFGANGLRLGCVVSHCQPFIDSLHYYSVFLFPSSAVDAIASRLLSDVVFTSHYIQENRLRISISYSYITTLLKKHDIPYSPGTNVAFFLWVELRSVYLRNRSSSFPLIVEQGAKLDKEINDKLLEKKVYLDSGMTLGAEKEGWWRLTFAQPESYVDEGLKRVLDALV